jgi:Spy/CpxP family protein refolding chaperone
MNPIIRAVQNPKIAAKLGLSEEQAAKLKTLAERQEELKGLQEKVRKGMEWQAELLKAKEVDRAAVMSAFDEVWAARKEIAKLQMSRLITVKSILTDEQVAKVREALQTMRNNPKGLKGDEPKVRKDGEPKVRNRDGVKVRRGCKGAKCDPKPEAKQE